MQVPVNAQATMMARVGNALGRAYFRMVFGSQNRLLKHDVRDEVEKIRPALTQRAEFVETVTVSGKVAAYLIGKYNAARTALIYNLSITTFAILTALIYLNVMAKWVNHSKEGVNSAITSAQLALDEGLGIIGNVVWLQLDATNQLTTAKADSFMMGMEALDRIPDALSGVVPQVFGMVVDITYALFAISAFFWVRGTQMLVRGIAIETVAKFLKTEGPEGNLLGIIAKKD